MGVLRLLEAIRATDPSIRFFQAGSSEMFGNVFGDVQNEYTEFRPRSPYGVAKLFAHWTAKNYRSLHGIHACNGILYNHTSRLQGSEFLASKVTKGMADIAQGRQQKIELGNLSAERDWGSAEDYVEAMWLMLQHPTPDDYVIATGSLVSVREFVELAARHVGIDIEWRGMGAEEQGLDRGTGNVIVSISPKFYRPSELGKLRGNASKALQTMGWRAKTSLTALVGSMTLSCCQ
jgi:GDPmannose 4,6-dehydratase